MPSPQLEKILTQLERVKALSGGEYIARCPAHSDTNPSLSIIEKDNKILLKCQAGCKTEDVVKAIGLTMSDLFLDKAQNPAIPIPSGHQESKPPPTIAATYDYMNENGIFLFQTVRFEPKAFRQRHKNGSGEWVWNLEGCRRVLYRLPEVIKAIKACNPPIPVFVVEGEKDVDNLFKLGFTATCNPMGAGKWNESYSDTLATGDIIVIPDNDKPGRDHATSIINSLLPKTRGVRLLEIPDAKDISDWIDKGGSAGQLNLLLAKCEPISQPLIKFPKKSIISKIQPEGFLQDYLTFCCRLTDAPAEFHLAAGLTILATVCGSNIRYPTFGGLTAWPNLYTLLIAPSGLYRKSTAIGMAKSLLSKVNRQLILPNVTTRESMVKLLRETPAVLYPISEFAAVLDYWKKDYAADMKGFITDIFDSQDAYVTSTIKDSRQEAKEPSFNILAGSTIDWLRDKLTEGDLRGGLMGRFLMVAGVDKGKDPGLNVQPDESLRAKMVGFLKSIAGLHNSWVDVRSQITVFRDWNQEMERKMLKQADPNLIGFQSRLGAHCLKLAILFCVGEEGPREKYELSAEHLGQAIFFTEWLHDRAQELAETGFIKGRFEKQMQKFLAYCQRENGIEHRTALQLMHCQSREFESIVKTALEREEITVGVRKIERRTIRFYLIRERT